MKNIIVLVIVLVMNVFGNNLERIKLSDSSKLPIEIISFSKNKVRNGIGESKLELNPGRFGLNTFELGKGYISQLTASIGGRKVLNLALSPFLYRAHSIIKFKFIDDATIDNIIFKVTDNHDKSIKRSFKIKRKIHTSNSNTIKIQQNLEKIKINREAWEATNIDEAIKILYGSLEKIKNLPEDKNLYINAPLTGICNPKKCSHDPGYPFYVAIKSKINIKSIAILSSTTPTSLLAVLDISKDEMVDVIVPFMLHNDGYVFIIVKGQDEKLYKSGSFHINTNIHAEMDFSTKIEFDIKK